MAPHKEPTRSDDPFEDVVLIKHGDSTVEVIDIGPLRLHVLEDGRHTDNRIGAVTITVPPHTPGPPQHWHQMHDETFLTIKGTATFTSRNNSFQAGVGDYVVVPPCSPHTFSNETDEEVVLYNTFTPAYYVNYFRLMAEMGRKSEIGSLTPAVVKRAMLQYATINVPPGFDWQKGTNPGKDPKNFGASETSATKDEWNA